MMFSLPTCQVNLRPTTYCFVNNDYPWFQIAALAGHADRVHDLIVCGVDPSTLPELSRSSLFPPFLSCDATHLLPLRFKHDDESDKVHHHEPENEQETGKKDDTSQEEPLTPSRPIRAVTTLLHFAQCRWTPLNHSFMYGPQFRAMIAGLSLVQVSSSLHRIVENSLERMIFDT